MSEKITNTHDREKRCGMTMAQAKHKCRAWREQGNPVSLRKAARLEAAFRDHPDYESDAAWLLRVQSGEQGSRFILDGLNKFVRRVRA